MKNVVCNPLKCCGNNFAGWTECEGENGKDKEENGIDTAQVFDPF